MSDNITFDYYRDVLANSLGLLGISVTAAQLEDLAADIVTARENESTAFGDEVASSNLLTYSFMTSMGDSRGYRTPPRMAALRVLPKEDVPSRSMFKEALRSLSRCV